MWDFVLLGLFKPNPFRKEQRADTDYPHRQKKHPDLVAFALMLMAKGMNSIAPQSLNSFLSFSLYIFGWMCIRYVYRQTGQEIFLKNKGWNTCTEINLPKVNTEIGAYIPRKKMYQNMYNRLALTKLHMKVSKRKICRQNFANLSELFSF